MAGSSYLTFDLRTFDDKVFDCLGNRLYRFLVSRIIRSNRMDYDPHDIYNNYYKNGLLATSWKNSVLSEKLNVSRSNISKNVKKLSNNGVIEVIKKRRNSPDIFILGIKNKNGKEELFSSNIAIKSKGVYEIKIDDGENSDEEIRKKGESIVEKFNVIVSKKETWSFHLGNLRFPKRKLLII